jgi:uncharacterized protein with PIN domain
MLRERTTRLSFEETVAKRKGPPPIGPRVSACVAPDLAETLRRRAAERDQQLTDAVREALALGVEAIRAAEAAEIRGAFLTTTRTG